MVGGVWYGRDRGGRGLCAGEEVDGREEEGGRDQGAFEGEHGGPQLRTALLTRMVVSVDERTADTPWLRRREEGSSSDVGGSWVGRFG